MFHTMKLEGIIIIIYYYYFKRQDFSVALEPVLELALVDHAGLKVTEIRLPLPPECWY